MDGKLTSIWLISLLLIISLHSSGLVSGTTFHESQFDRRKLMTREGFISISCGIASGSSYTNNETQIHYTSDSGFIDTGINYNISMDYVDKYTNYQHLMNVRSFPEGDRNCYTLRPGQGKNHKYLIRTRFKYGNYDSKNQPPVFKLYLGVEEWATVNMTDTPNDMIKKEIIHVPITDYIDVCLVNNGLGTPFISMLELRPLNDLIYSPSEPGSLLLYNRWDIGKQDYEWPLVRDKDDVYDRIWQSRIWIWPEWMSINSSLVSSSYSASEYKLPESVMATAATPVNESESMQISFDIDDDPSQRLYMYMHFAEVEDLKGEIREFTVSVNGQSYGGPVKPRYLFTDTIPSNYSMSGSTTGKFSVSLERTSISTLPPIINAMELYRIKEFSQSSTQQDDVDAIKMIKSGYNVSWNWQGDPCLPTKYQWNGLTCSLDTSPTIISLNLSSSNLSGNILASFSNLKSLQSLDLSYNNLTGPVPEFFAELPSLKILNLRGNNLTGSVPQAVMDKFKDGSFGENPNLCLSDSCQGKKKNNKKFIVPVVISSLSVIVVLIITTTLALIMRKFKRRETKECPKEEPLKTKECPKEGPLKSGNYEFTYSEVVVITNSFNSPIGRGGFGQVYLGTLDGTQVAVKVHSPSSNQGHKAFQAEATLLMRVHHKNLVRLIGYCNDRPHMALIYEYMSNGNLRHKLSGIEADALNWKQRLEIAVDAAQGLEYLHNGCKPGIVHRDVKSSNILLTETLQAKIADFGMSRDVENLSTYPVGTPGYVDPECQHSTGNLNEKSDVYSFGIVLLELITGRPAIENPGSIHIVGWVRPKIQREDIGSIVDPRLQEDFNTNSALRAVEIALACVASKGMERPDMSQVLADLKECLEEVTSTESDNFITCPLGPQR